MRKGSQCTPYHQISGVLPRVLCYTAIARATLLQRGQFPTTVFFANDSDHKIGLHVAKKNGQVRLIFLANYPHAKRTVCYETFFANDPKHFFLKEDMTLIIANYLDHRDGPDPCKEDDNFF